MTTQEVITKIDSEADKLGDVYKRQVEGLFLF